MSSQYGRKGGGGRRAPRTRRRSRCRRRVHRGGGRSLMGSGVGRPTALSGLRCARRSPWSHLHLKPSEAARRAGGTRGERLWRRPRAGCAPPDARAGAQGGGRSRSSSSSPETQRRRSRSGAAVPPGAPRAPPPDEARARRPRALDGRPRRGILAGRGSVAEVRLALRRCGVSD